MHSFFFLALLPLAHCQLHDAAKHAGLLFFGTATDNPELTDAAYLAQLSNSSEFGQITPGNSMKWDAIEPAPGNFTFAAGDVIADLAKKNNQLIRCHNLVWHQQLPSWVTTTNWTKASLTAALQFHVTTEVDHYKGQCYSWDVVNEALNDNGTFRNDVFFKILGEDYIKIAFDAAAAADPDVKLYYNDFNTEFPGAKSKAALNIVKTLKAAGTKIDGVGFQSHFLVGSTPSIATQLTNMGAFTALGIEVAVTELDIRMTLPATPALIAQQQTDYQTATAGCLALKGCVGVTVWDFDDAFSWVPSTFPGTGSACIMDETLTKKPAYFGALAALTGSNPQPPSNGTNGTFTFGNNVTSTSRPSKATFVSGATTVASNLIWPVLLVVVLFV